MASTTRGYFLAADWSRSGSFDGTLERLNPYLLGDAGQPLVVRYGRDTTQPSAPMTAGRMDFTLRNKARPGDPYPDGLWFSPENGSSPIAGLVLPGRKVLLSLDYTSVSDDFTRDVADEWGTATSGQPWTTSGGSASDYYVSDGAGQHSIGSVGVTRSCFLDDVLVTDLDLSVKITIPVVPTGNGGVETGLRLRQDSGSSNYYIARLRVNPDTSVDATWRRALSGVFTTLATNGVVWQHSAGMSWWLRANLAGPTLRMKVWPTTAAEPVDWTTTATDTSHTSGRLGVRTQLAAGNTNSLPVVVTYDSLGTAGRVLLQGTIDTLDFDTDSVSEPVAIGCLDGWGQPGSEQISTLLHQGYRTGDAINLVLDLIGR